MRCKCCDNVLKNREIYINKKTGMFEELCGLCRGYAFNPDADPELETVDSIEEAEDTSKLLDERGETW